MGNGYSEGKPSRYQYRSKAEEGKDIYDEDPEHYKINIQRDNDKKWLERSGKITQSLKKFLRTVERYGKFYAVKTCGVSQNELDELLLHNLRFKELYYAALSLTELQVNFIEVYRKKLGNVAKTCEVVGVSRSLYHNWVNVSKTFKLELSAIEQGIYDDVETVMLQKALVDKDTTMLIWLSKTKMKDRGYIDSKQVDNTHTLKEGSIKRMSDEELDKRIGELREDSMKFIESKSRSVGRSDRKAEKDGEDDEFDEFEDVE